jgi:predicted nucleotidyltransferase
VPGDVLILHQPAPFDSDEIARRLAPVLRRLGAHRAWLIGSFARGTADAWSDVDLMITAETDLPFVERPLAFGELLDALPVATDLLIYTPAEMAAGMRRGTGIFAILEDEGKLIYER